jgi:phosphocarrier protein HPr
MKQIQVTVQWEDGLHLRPAAKLVKVAQRFNSRILLRIGSRLADARSIMNVLLLSATLGTCLDVEIAGTDEHEAERAVKEFFQDQTGGGLTMGSTIDGGNG